MAKAKKKGKRFVLTGDVKAGFGGRRFGGRGIITIPMSHEDALKAKKRIQAEVKIAIPNYKWVKNIRLKGVD